MRKRILPLILTLIMALSLLSTVALADNGVSWKLEDGTLTISGVGAMEMPNYGFALFLLFAAFTYAAKAKAACKRGSTVQHPALL